MNERIRELMLEAGYAAPEIAGRGQLLAELIVERCMALCDGNHEYKNHADTEFSKGVSTGIQLSKNMINVHFGEKE